MSTARPRVMTPALIVLTVAVIAIVAAVIIGAFSAKGTTHVKTAAQAGHTLMPVTPASVKTCLNDQGVATTQSGRKRLIVRTPGQRPLRLKFLADFDAASAQSKPGTALNNVSLSEDVSQLTQLEIYALDYCVVKPGEAGGRGATKSKKAPVESVTS